MRAKGVEGLPSGDGQVHSKAMSTRTQKQGVYDAYLKTAAWRDKRLAVLERDGGCCQKCGAETHLHVHHKTYKRLFHEELKDLVTWCKPCHVAHHQDKKNRRKGRKRGVRKVPANYTAANLLPEERPKTGKFSIGICRGCGAGMQRPFWFPGGGYYCGEACLPRK